MAMHADDCQFQAHTSADQAGVKRCPLPVILWVLLHVNTVVKEIFLFIMFYIKNRFLHGIVNPEELVGALVHAWATLMVVILSASQGPPSWTA